jgi:phage shock protein A
MRVVIAISLWLWAGVVATGYEAVQGCAAINKDAKSALDLSHAALDFYADSIPPAHDLATDLCLLKQDAVTKQAEAHDLTAADARAQVTGIRAQCDRVDAQFTEVVRVHELAKAAYSAGNSGELDRLLAQLKVTWQGLSPKGPGS